MAKPEMRIRCCAVSSGSRERVETQSGFRFTGDRDTAYGGRLSRKSRPWIFKIQASGFFDFGFRFLRQRSAPCQQSAAWRCCF